MNITLNQQEIEEALENYVNSQGISIVNKNVSVSLVAGRGVNGHTANIEISELHNVAEKNILAEPVKRRGRPPKDNTPVEDVSVDSDDITTDDTEKNVGENNIFSMNLFDE